MSMGLQIRHKPQQGFALLIFLLTLMGLGGIALAGFTQQTLRSVEQSRLEHNKQVLQQAKDALLFYAYNYPSISATNRGPGRLPCPYDEESGYSGTLSDTICSAVGRFPWQNNLNTGRLTDAIGETLWYAVSEEFRNFDSADVGANSNGDDVVNSDSQGTITVFDQSGNLRYSGAAGGIAAIVIAPGAVISRDENDDGVYEYTQVRGTDAEKEDPRNYLDTFGSFDNSVFENGFADTADGFIIGPVFDSAASTIVVNDQFILVTTDEVVAMAEKATLQAYRDALAAYDQRIDTDVAPGDNYPWLFNFSVNEYGAGYPELDEYPADTNFNDELDTYIESNETDGALELNGRIPSIFSEYFSEADSRPVESEIGVDLTVTYPLGNINYVQGDLVTTGTFEIDQLGINTFNYLSIPFEEVKFVDAVPGDGEIDLQGISKNSEFGLGSSIYYWDSPISGDGFELCGDGANQRVDCHRDGSGDLDPGGPNIEPTRVLGLRMVWQTTAANVYKLAIATPPINSVVTDSASVSGHAIIRADFDSVNYSLSELTDWPIRVRYEFGEIATGGAYSAIHSGFVNLADLTNISLGISVRYYPELPQWAHRDENAWHESILMAYAKAYRPDDAAVDCVVGDAGNPCLTIQNSDGSNNDNKSLLIIGGRHDWSDQDDPGLQDDLISVFDTGNHDLNETFDARANATVLDGDDQFLIVDKL